MEAGEDSPGLVTITVPINSGIGTYTLRTREARRLLDTARDLGMNVHDYVKLNPEKLLDAIARTLEV